MIVTFKTKSYPDIIMFGDVAKTLLRMMGHSGTVPGALRAADTAAARQRLRAALDEHGDDAAPAEVPADDQEGAGEEPRISLEKRAFPLLELLDAASSGGHDVTWA
jgi:hypothetical protein